MCDVCGCGQGEVNIEGHGDGHRHDHNHDHPQHAHIHGEQPKHQHLHEHVHAHQHVHPNGHQREEDSGPTHDYGQGPARAHAPGLSQARMLQIEQDILSKNNAYAGQNRTYFDEHSILALNLVSSPGSGKTTLLTRTIGALTDSFPIAVVEGDQQTNTDAARIRATGVPAVQINTGKGCHLDAHMVGHALESLQLSDRSVLFIENVGNLVCPASFDLGEAHKVVILSVTEGDDKPLKYSDMFHAADLMLINKIDLLPYVDFDVSQCVMYARRVNPGIETLQLSAATGEGVDAWHDWLRGRLRSRIDTQVRALELKLAQLKSGLASAEEL